MSPANPTENPMPDTIERLESRIQDLEEKLATVQAGMPSDQLSMVVFSGDLDRILAAFIIASGAAAMYDRVVMFFTIWATPSLCDTAKKTPGADFMARMFEMMLPRGADQLKLSRMNMAGIGTRMMRMRMKEKGVMSLAELMKTAADFGVEIVVCEMAMNLMGINPDEIIDYPDITIAGVGKFLQEAGNSKVTLFI